MRKAFASAVTWYQLCGQRAELAWLSNKSCRHLYTEGSHGSGAAVWCRWCCGVVEKVGPSRMVMGDSPGIREVLTVKRLPDLSLVLHCQGAVVTSVRFP